MQHQHQLIVSGKPYTAVVISTAHNGRAVLISLVAEQSEVGLVKLVASFPDAMLKWGHLNEEQFLQAAWSQFVARGLAAAALAAEVRPQVFELQYVQPAVQADSPASSGSAAYLGVEC